MLKKYFGSLQNFKDEFSEAAKNLFGSGWVWLIKNSDSSLSIECTSNADTHLLKTARAVLTCDAMWEHAYYLDYQNERAKYMSPVLENR